jgi:hypothetical protein
VPHDVGRQTVPCRRWTPLGPDAESAPSHMCTVGHSSPHRFPPATPLAPRASRSLAGRADHVAAPPTASSPYLAHARRHAESFRGRVVTFSPRHTHLYKGQKLTGHARCAVAQSRAASPWPSTPSSHAHSVSQPFAPLGSFARTYWSSPSHTLPGETNTQTGPRRTLDPAQALPRPAPPEFPLAAPPPSPKGHIARSQVFLGGWAQIKGISVKFKSFQGPSGKMILHLC